MAVCINRPGTVSVAVNSRLSDKAVTEHHLLKDFSSQLKRHRLLYLKTQLNDAARRRRELAVLLFMLVPVSPVIFGWPILAIALLKAPAPSDAVLPIVLGYGITLVLLLGALLWVHMLRDAISGSRFGGYTRTLPVPMFIHNRLDLLALCLVNFPLWLMVVVSLVTAPYARLSAGDIWLFLLRVTVLIIFILYAQRRFIRSRRGIAVPALAVSTLLTFSTLLTYPAHVALLALTVFILVASVCASCLPVVGTFKTAALKT